MSDAWEVRGQDAETLAVTHEFNDWLERRLAAEPRLSDIGPVEARRRRRAGEAAFPPPPVFLDEAEDREIAGRAGPIRLRVVRPERDPAGLYLHLHGGGWVLGNADAQDPMLRELAQATGLCAVSVEYRLAPEDPYPAAVEDCEDAARWLLERGPAELGAPARCAIGGESAGAHLSAVTLLRLRDGVAGGNGFAAANLAFGCYDLSMSPSQRLWGERNLILSTPIIELFAELFLPGVDLEARRSPEISPLFADLRGLPPAVFTVGTLDPLLDDTLFMAARWRAAGNEATVQIWQDAVHAFTASPTPAAVAARAAQHAALAPA
jgi:acetyl esterase